MSSIFQRIQHFNKGYLPDKVQLKYQSMSDSPYRFFRGTCHLFYEDLYKTSQLPGSPHVWISGDLHVENLGTFKGDNRLVYFDLNDFDEAILGFVNWELVRMTTSIFVAFEYLKIEDKKAVKWANLFLNTYYDTLAKGKTRYIEPRIATGIIKKFLTKVSERKKIDLIKKHTKRKKGSIILNINKEKLEPLEPEFKEELIEYVQNWLKRDENTPYNFDVIDACFRIAGTGSLGVKRYLFLLQSKKDRSEIVLLDMKQATPSSLVPFINIPQPNWENEAVRTIEIQQRMQNVAPALLSTMIFKGEPFVVQEMQPVEDKIDFTLIKNKYKEVCQVIDAMAMLTASSQLRSCSRQGAATADELLELGNSKYQMKEIFEYANVYAKQVKNDYYEFLKEYKESNTMNRN